ncbi:MAG: hydrogenobyrinic acid a,c-diamide synthase (glutamine-hydrolyzing) [Thermoleophilia bacterium]|nr:hydrogenobyrinic acid a,c-diamide synthase (glutamine-hydrolyzing) [Thermoleophilia bacterium]
MKNLQLPRIVVSAPHRSSGKTTLSIGLGAALTGAGLAVQPFKKGPDFIDPMWLAAATGRDCHNLDLFMMGQERIMESFQRAAAGADLSLIEGNMGLYDSTDLGGKGSTSDMARFLRAPIILIVSTRNLTRSIAPLLLGFQRFEPDIAIAGVILNKVSGPRHEAKLTAAIDRYTDLEVVGAIRRRPEIGIIQRHLGLKPAAEELGAEAVIDSITTIVAESVNLGRIRDIAGAAPPLPELDIPGPAIPAPAVRIGVARDRAFTFYYPENLEALRAAGARLVPFSPLTGESLPAVDGLYIGGGFPEVFMEELEANARLRREIRRAVEGGMPVYAECGGLMYLSRAMSWNGRAHEMVGALPCDIVMHEKPRGHGYMELEATGAGGWFEPGLKIRGHEFHYSEIVNLEDVQFAYRVTRGSGVDGEHDGIVHRNVMASYTHLHSLGSPGWAEGFVEFVKKIAAAIA